MRLILVRHALPHRGEAGVNGVADPGLTELGRRQAARVVGAVDGERIEAIYTSPQRRARETAEPLAAALGVAATVTPGLAEYDSGDRHYVPVHEMAEADPAAWARMLAGQLPEHVDLEAFRMRVDGALGTIADAHPGAATVVCFAHAGTINVYLATLLGLARPLSFPLDYAGITRVTLSRGGRRSVRTVNEIAHVADLLDPSKPSSPGSPGSSGAPTPRRAG